MYNFTKNFILNGGKFELSLMIQKIDALWIENKIDSKEKRDELIDLARQHADPEQSVDAYAKLQEFDERLRLLEEKVKNLASGQPVPPATEEETYPEYEVGKIYRNGDKVTFKGKQYKCICPSYTTCVWSPEDYPDYWKAL